MTQYEYILEMQKQFTDIKDVCFWGVHGGISGNEIEGLCKGCRREKRIDCTNGICQDEIKKVLQNHMPPQVRQPSLWEGMND